MRKKSFFMALGGVTAALAVTVMCLGTLIPLATYVCPVICVLILQVVLRICGKRTAWTWYGVVSILTALLAPDREAAAIFVFLGYYPIIKPYLDKRRLSWLWKLIFFNGATFAAYAVLIWMLGISELAASFQELGLILSVVTLFLGNLTFFLLDKLLSRRLVLRS